jgi:predicted transcriptional regulator
MITLNQQTEQQLQDIASQTNQSIQQLIELFIQDYQAEQQSIKRADNAYAEYINSGERLSLQQIKQANDLAN